MSTTAPLSEECLDNLRTDAQTCVRHGGRAVEVVHSQTILALVDEVRRLRDAPRVDDKIVEQICQNFCETHDGPALWEHVRRDPEAFRHAVRVALGRRYQP